MNILDDLEKMAELDKQDMLGVEENFVNQIAEAKKIAESAEVEDLKSKDFAGVAILGMGGSGFTGDIIQSLIVDSVGIPVTVIKGYGLPAFIGSGWLVISVSYSGNTEETISALMQALQRDCEILCISSGGRIEDIAKEYKKTHVKIPSGFQPRGASGYLIFTSYLVMNRIGIIEIADEDISETMDLLEKKSIEYDRNTRTDENFAKKLAFELFDYFPVVFGVEGFLSAIAYRWKCEINENSKCPCFWGEFPELNHNETVGWQNLSEITSCFVLVVFNDREATERIKVRISTTIKLLKDNFGKVIEVPVQGKSKLARALSTMYLGDIASVYLAYLYGVDPTPVDRISVLKSELSKLDS
jgi:glucose/mannose-6-phosphate isomerase